MSDLTPLAGNLPVAPSPSVAAAHDLLALAEELGTAAEYRLVCAPTGYVLAHRSRPAPDGVGVPDVAALAAYHATVLFGPARLDAGTLRPSVVNAQPLLFSNRPVTLAGESLQLIELTALAVAAAPEEAEGEPVDPDTLPELLAVEVHRETQRLSTVIALDGTYRAVNAVTERLLRRPANRILGHTVGQVLRLSVQEVQRLDQAAQQCLRGQPQHLTWWYRTPDQATPVTADVTLRAVRFAGEVAIHTLTRLLTDPRDPVHAAHLRNSQLELANFLLGTANRFQQPVRLLEFVLEQLVSKSPAVGGALYAYDAPTHGLVRQLLLGADHPAGLPVHLPLRSATALVARLNRRKMRVASRLLAAEFGLARASENTVAVLPVCSDHTLHYVLVLTLPPAATLQHTWLTSLLGLISDGLNSVVTRELLRSELATTEHRYQVLFNASADGILLTDGRRVVEANQTAADLLGYSPAELLSTNDIAALLIGPDASALGVGPLSWRELVRTTRGTGAAHTFEARLRRADGTRLPVEVRVRPVPLGGGVLAQVLLRDIGERVSADEAMLRAEVLRQSARELRNLLGSLSLAYVSFDRDATILAVNDFFVELVGYAREELLGRNYFDVFVIDPSERTRRHEYYQNHVLRDGQIEAQYESIIYTRAGDRLIMRWNRLFERDASGQVQATISIGRDVTAGVLAEEDSQRNRARFQDLFDNAHDLIQLLSPDNHFLSVNRAWHETLGYTEGDLSALTLPDVVHPYHSAKLMHQLRTLYRGEDAGQIETVLLTRDGRPVHLIGSVSAHWHEGQVVAARLILHDITERIRAERLQKAYYSIANLAISARDLDTLYGAIHRDLSRLLDTHNFFITLCDEARTRLTLAYTSDPALIGRAVGEARPYGRGATEYIIGQGSPVLLQRRELEAMIAAGTLQLQMRLPEVLAGVPLTVGGRIIGALMLVDYTDPDTYKPADLDVLYFISSQVALAIDRKRNEVLLHRQNARLSAIFESGSHLMWAVSPTRRLTAYNRNFAHAFFSNDSPTSAADARIAGFDELGTPLDLRLVLGQNAGLWEREYAAAFAGETRQFEVRNVQNDGDEAWAEIYLNPILLPDGTLEEVSGIAHDITEKKLTQLELTRQEELFRGIFESFQDVYYRTDVRGRLVLLSPSVESNFGYCAPDLIGQTGATFFADPARYAEFLDAVRRDGQVQGFEATCYDSTGQPRDVLITARHLPATAGQPTGLEGLVKDISSLKQVQHDLLLAKQDAELALHAKTQFLANMSHELRTPMNGIIGMIELLEHTVQTSVQGGYVETLRRSSDALLAILNDILDLSKMQAGKLAIALAPVDLLDVLAKVKALFANRATQKALSFTSEVALDVPRFVETDETRLLQILSNLTANAIKFTNHGGVSITLRVDENFAATDDQVQLRFEVVDSGIGIAPEDAARLFTDFTQLDTTSTKAYGGTGLGLSISRQLADLLGGDIGVQPNPAGGSVFWFTIACRPADETTGRQWAAEREAGRARRAPGRFSNAPAVLLVDDNVVNQTVSARLLELLGCEVDVAGTGIEALQRLTAPDVPAYAVVLMDIQMPGLDGIETTRRLRAYCTSNELTCPPVVAMTAYSMPGDAERFRRDGFDDYVAKPVTSRDLFAAIRRQVPDLPVEAAWAPPPTPAVAPPLIEPALVPDPVIIKQLTELGGEDFVREMFREFVAEAAPQLTQAAADLAAGDFDKLLAPVHQLKGASAQLGLTALADAARTVEQLVRQPNPPVETVTADFARLRMLFTTFAAAYVPPASAPDA